MGYTAQMAQSEEVGLRLRVRHRAVFGPLARRYRGEIVDENGDELVLAFPSAVDAVNCALAVQADLRDDAELRLRIGIHLGDVIFEGGRVYGDGVNVASRIRPLAEPGGICVSEPVHDSVKNQPNVSASSLGPQTLKNVARPMEAFRVEGPAGPAPAVAVEEMQGTSRLVRRLRTALVAIAVTASVMALALWASWPRPLGLLIDLTGVSGPPVNPPLPDKPSIAVLPFANMSADPEQEYFSDGITEDLTTALAGNPYLFVISRNSAFTYKGKVVKIEDVGRELGVRYVLEGSVRKAGERVRITAQLIDATTGGHLWSQRYDRDLSDIFAVQSEMAEAILGAVGVEIEAAEGQRLARKPTENLSAVDALWKGEYLLDQLSRKGNEEAVRLFERAIELDPSFAIAHALLGQAYYLQRSTGWSSDPNLIDRAEELGRRAIELDPSEPFGHETIAWVNVFRGNSAEAIAAAERAIECAPNFQYAHAARGIALLQEGRFIEATRSIRKALRLNPRASTGLLGMVAVVNYGAGRTDEAVEMWEQIRDASPDLINPRISLAAYYEREGQHDRASAVVEEILRVRADFTAQDAIDLLPGAERVLGPEEFARFTDALRKAGLP